MERAVYRGMKYDPDEGLLLMVELAQNRLISVPFAEGTRLIEERIAALGGNLVLIRAGFLDNEDAFAVLTALTELTSALGGRIYL